jgi:hypothetical protein
MDYALAPLPAVLFRGLLLLAAAFSLAVVPSCTQAQAPKDTPQVQGAVAAGDGSSLRLLFVGNSLTAGNDLPGLVEAMASTGGIKVRTQAVVFGNFSLEDHWNNGQARKVLASARWDYLVLQQGPSSRPESQANLRTWAKKWADEARQHGATPALYMVWPFQGQKEGFELVSQSYRAAATASQARILPAGEAWQEALRLRTPAPLYQEDRLHPTVAGTYLAALVITHELTGVKPRSIPARLKLTRGVEVALPQAQVDKLQQAAQKVHKEE